MTFWLLPLVLSIFFLGMNALSANQSRQLGTPTTQVIAQVSAQAFASYRNAVGSYMIANPAFTGIVPPASLVPYLAPNQPIPVGAANQINLTASGSGRIAYAWIALPPGAAFSMIESLGGDASIGVVSGTQWVSPVYGVEGVPPTFVPNGSALSMVQVGS